MVIPQCPIIRYAPYFVLLWLKFSSVVRDSVLIMITNAIIYMFHRILWCFSFFMYFSSSQIVYLSPLCPCTSLLTYLILSPLSLPSLSIPLSLLFDLLFQTTLDLLLLFLLFLLIAVFYIIPHSFFLITVNQVTQYKWNHLKGFFF